MEQTSTHQPSELDACIDEQGREFAQASISESDGQSILYVAPTQAIPIVFLPGIMGSPLIATGKNMAMWEKQGGWAWFPDDMKWMLNGFRKLDALERRQLLNPAETRAVETPEEADQALLEKLCGDNLLIPYNEAARRGWGSVMVDSYGDILKYLEIQLRFIIYRKTIYPGTQTALVRDTSVWGNVTGYERLSEEQLYAAAGWRFPVYAMGYNWLQSNGDTAQRLKNRIEAIRQDCRERLKLRCDKVILVTHSMGGLVARSYAQKHPQDVLGVVHGVQPAIGAATAYARVRTGWEAPDFKWLSPWKSVKNHVAANILGPTGREVSAVFAGAAGTLELLPNQLYGNHWLQVQDKDGQTLFSLPKENPYEEIYKQYMPWWRLIHPSSLVGSNFTGTEVWEQWDLYLEQLAIAQDFHTQLGSYYHPNTYAHCGADDELRAWHTIRWRLKPLYESKTGLWARPPQAMGVLKANVDYGDYMKGNLIILDRSTAGDVWVRRNGVGVVAQSAGAYYRAMLQEQDESGDGTVSAHSGQAPSVAAKFFARMRGFDHQDSYQDPHVKAVTLYSILRIAAEAESLQC